ncbi:MAG: proteasome accessory factor PafA2 family protein [Pirellulaceae bacterium]
MPLLDRLMGMETEYAIRLPAGCGIASHRDAFLAVIGSLRRRLPTADADVLQSGKAGLFLASGGAVWIESLRPATNFCFIEGATPECRTPLELLACQRAQDRLLERSAGEHGISLLKNCCDHRETIYGAQESFNVELLSGFGLWVWRVLAVCVFLPLALAAQLLAIGAILVWLICVPLTAIVYRWRSRGKRKSERDALFDFWVGRVFRSGWDGVELPGSGLFSGVILIGLLIAVAPLAACVWLSVELTPFGRRQRQLAGFIASRIIFTGAGHVDQRGHFCLAEKTARCRRVSTIVEYGHGFFSLGQFIKPVLTVVRLPELFSSRQRLQITMSDANMCEESEYLRIGTTLLMIEAIEASEASELPMLRNPVKSLLRFNRDPSFQARCKLKGGESLTAIELQRRYLQFCRQHLTTLGEVPDEIQDVVDRWENVLDELEQSPQSLIGRLDWVTKKYFIDTAADPEHHDAIKKIDLRYHELSDEGYFRQFEKTGLHQRILQEDDIEKATRMPPMNTPAHWRARYIREHSINGVGIGWKTGAHGRWETR